MFVPFTAVLVDPDASTRHDVAQALSGHGVVLAGQLDDVEQLPAMLARMSPPRVAIVNLDPDPRNLLRRIGSLIGKHPAVRFFAMAHGASAELVMDAMDVGITAFLPLPLDPVRLGAAIERMSNSADIGRRAKVIQFVPTVGGCGATTIACGVAASLAKVGKTLILDLDLVRGAVGNGFDVRPRHSIADVVGANVQLDKAKLEAALAVHRDSGLAVLARPESPEDAQHVTRDGLAQVIDVAGRAFDFVVMDSTMGMDPLHAAATRAADLNVLVLQLSVPSAKNAERYLHALRRMGIDAAATSRLVINRFTPERSDIQPVEIERALGLKITWMLPNDFPTAMASINFGEPVTQRSPRTELSRSIVALAQLLAARDAEPAARQTARPV